MGSIFVCTSFLLASAPVLSAFSGFSSGQLNLLRDPAGWDYIKMTYTGMRTEHPCFTGKPPSDECSGRLVLLTDNRFVQEVTIHGRTVPRHGTYSLKDNQLTFVDELETPDGPYTVEFDARTHLLVMSMPQIRIELAMHKPMPAPYRRLDPSSSLTAEQLKLLKDPGGWDYIKMTSNGGIQTEHACFDGTPHPGECSGRLTLGTDDKFLQTVTIHGDSVPRHGTYTLEDDRLTFFDELEKSDGPYTIEIDPQAKSLVMYMPQVRVELMLHKAMLDKKRKERK